MHQGTPHLVIPPRRIGTGGPPPPPPPRFDDSEFWDPDSPRWPFEVVIAALSLAALFAAVVVMAGFIWWLVG